MYQVNITAIGNSAGIILPKELLAKCNLAKGDALYLTETEDGIALTPYNPEFEEQIIAASQIMKEDRDILKVLAKNE